MTETSCSKTFGMPAGEMTTGQIERLVEQNAGSRDIDPAAIAELREKLAWRKRMLEEAQARGFWPPLRPDPDCLDCGGTGYSSCWSDEPGKEVYDVGRCICNVERLEEERGEDGAR